MVAYNHHNSNGGGGGALGLRWLREEATSIPGIGEADANWVVEEPEKEENWQQWVHQVGNKSVEKSQVGDRRQWLTHMYTDVFLTGSICRFTLEDLDVLGQIL